MGNEDAATTSSVTVLPELQGDLVDRLDRAAEKLATPSSEKPSKKRLFGLVNVA